MIVATWARLRPSRMRLAPSGRGLPMSYLRVGLAGEIFAYSIGDSAERGSRHGSLQSDRDEARPACVRLAAGGGGDGAADSPGGADGGQLAQQPAAALRRPPEGAGES